MQQLLFGNVQQFSSVRLHGGMSNENLTSSTRTDIIKLPLARTRATFSGVRRNSVRYSPHPIADYFS
jgi:hypothetical protein